MNDIYLLLTFTVIFTSLTSAHDCKGCVSLDEYSFDKVISKFKAVLVKFDVSYPYGDKENVYTKFSEEIGKNKDILIAQVGVQDYGDKNNEELAKQYGITKDDFPVVLLFLEGKKNPVSFPSKSEWNVNDFRHFVRDNAKIYIGLPGCIESFDKLAMEFISTSNKEEKLKEAEIMSETLKDESTASIYIKLMNKIIEQGIDFVSQEMGRLNKILKDGKLNKKKREELSHKINILHSFAMKARDEL